MLVFFMEETHLLRDRFFVSLNASKPIFKNLLYAYVAASVRFLLTALCDCIRYWEPTF